MPKRKEWEIVKRTVCILFIVSLLLTLVGCRIPEKKDKITEVIAYISEEMSDAEAKAIGTKINRIPDIVTYEFISREDALDAFLKEHPEEEAFAGIEARDLRHRYLVTVKADSRDAVVEHLESIEGIAKVQSGDSPSLLEKLIITD